MKCDVSLLEMKDSKEEGIEHKLLKAWPVQISRGRMFQTLLKPALTQKMRDEKVNGQVLVYQKIV